MGLLIGVIGLALIVCFAFGFTDFRLKSKIGFVLFTVVAYFFLHFIYWEADVAFGINRLYTPILIAAAVSLVLIATGFKALINRFK